LPTTLQLAPPSNVAIRSTVGFVSGCQRTTAIDPGDNTLAAAGDASGGAALRLTDVVAWKHWLPISPLAVTGGGPVPHKVPRSSDRLILIERSGMPSPSASPIETGAPGATSTVPFTRMEARSMSEAEAGGTGSRTAVIHLPFELVLITPGSTVS